MRQISYWEIYQGGRPVKVFDLLNNGLALPFIGCNIYLRKKGGLFSMENQTTVTTTEHQIGKVTYFVCSSASEHATDTLDKKIKKLIRKDVEQNTGNARK